MRTKRKRRRRRRRRERLLLQLAGEHIPSLQLLVAAVGRTAHAAAAAAAVGTLRISAASWTGWSWKLRSRRSWLSHRDRHPRCLSGAAAHMQTGQQ
jgi:hypothetical protein